MRKLDLIIQSLLLLPALAFVPAIVMIDKGFLVWILILQFFLGIVQVLSALITTMNTENASAFRKRAIRIYWLLVLVYCIIISVLLLAKMETVAMIWFFSAWGIAIYYYVFTWRMVTGTTQRKRFLDVLN
jgi:hypothetical protein